MRNMKKTIALCISLIMLVMTVGGISAVGAASIDAEAYFSAGIDGFIVKGTVTDSETDNVSIFIYRPGYTLEQVSDGTAKITNAVSNATIERLVSGTFYYECMASTVTDSGGNDKDPTGNYTVYIKYGTGDDDLLTISNVYYTRAEEVLGVVDRIEEITGTPEEKLAAFEEDAVYLGKLPDEYEQLSPSQKEAVIDAVITEGVSFDSAAALIESIKQESITAILLNPSDKDDVAYAIENYNDKIGYDTNNTFYKMYVEGYSDRIAAVYAYTASKAPFADTTAAKDAFQEGVILQALNNIAVKGELYNPAVGSVSVLGDAYNISLLPGLDMTGYKNLSTTKMETMLTSFVVSNKHKTSTLAQFITNWNNAVIAAKNSTGVGGTGGGGGGGGAGGGSLSDITTDTGFGISVPGGSTEDTPALSVEDYFVDIADVQWAQESIIGLAKAGIVSGKDATHFAPNDNITREEFLKMLYLCANLQINEDAQATFIDVNPGEWYYSVIASAQEQGLVNGVTNVRFGVGENITRQDMSVMIVRMISSLGIDLDLSVDEAKFTDDVRIAPYAEVSVYTMKWAGIINGYEDGSFRPEAYATRAEAAKIIFALCNLMLD